MNSQDTIPSRVLRLLCWGLLAGGLWALAYCVLLRWHDPMDVAHSGRFAIVPWVLIGAPLVSLVAGTFARLSPETRMIGTAAGLVALLGWAGSLPFDRMYEYPHPPGRPALLICLGALALAMLIVSGRQAGRLAIGASGWPAALHVTGFLLFGAWAALLVVLATDRIEGFCLSEGESPLGYLLPRLAWGADVCLVLLLVPILLPPSAAAWTDAPLSRRTAAVLAGLWGAFCAGVPCAGRAVIDVAAASAAIGALPRSVTGAWVLLVIPLLAVPTVTSPGSGVTEPTATPLALSTSVFATGLLCRTLFANRSGWWQRLPLAVIIFACWTLASAVVRPPATDPAKASDGWSIVGLLMLALAAHPPCLAIPEPRLLVPEWRSRRVRIAWGLTATGIGCATIAIVLSTVRTTPPSVVPTPAESMITVSNKLPAGAIARLGTTRLRSDHSIEVAGISRDGSTLALAGFEGVRLADGWGRVSRIVPWPPHRHPQTNPEVDRDCRTARTVAVALSPTGDRFAAAMSCGTIHVRSTINGRGWQAHAPHTSVTGLRFSHDGRYVAAFGSEILVCEASSGRSLVTHREGVTDRACRLLTGPDERPRFTAADWSPDSGHLAVGDDAGAVTMLRVGPAGVAWHRSIGRSTILSVRFGSQGNVMGAGTNMGLCLLDPAGGGIVRSFAKDHPTEHCPADDAAARELVYVRPGSMPEATLAICASRGARHTLVVSRHERLEGLSTQRRVATWSRDNSPIEQMALLWDLSQDRRLGDEDGGGGGAGTATFGLDANTLLVGYRDALVREWNVNTATVQREFGHPDESTAYARFSPLERSVTPTGTTLFRGYQSLSMARRLKLLASINPFGSLEVRDLRTARVLKEQRNEGIGFDKVWFADNDRRLILCAFDRMMVLVEPDWRVHRDIPVEPMRSHVYAGLNAGGVTPDGRHVLFVSGHERSRIVVQEVDTGRRIIREAPLQWIGRLVFSPGGQDLYASGSGGVCHWASPWLTSSPRRLGPAVDAGAVAVSPTGNCLAIADGALIRLHALPSGEELARLTGHTGAVTDLQFSPDGARLVSTSADTTVMVWHGPRP